MNAASMVAPGLVKGTGAQACLLGGRRMSDGRIVFPMPVGPEAQLYEEIELARQGTLWSFTVQRFRPKPPYDGDGDEAGFTPYAVGYVELPGQIIVESRIATDDPDNLRIGMTMDFTLQAYGHDSDGAEVLTYAFSPAH